MKNKKPYKDETLNTLAKALAEETVYKTESEELEELANNSGEFVDFVLGQIRDRIHDCQVIKDHKGAAALNDLFDAIIEKLEEE